MTDINAPGLSQVVDVMLGSIAFSGAPMRKTLFQLLWNNRGQKTKGHAIWQALWPEAQKDNFHEYRTNIRQQCSALSKALDDYFNRGRHGWDTTSRWAISLKAGGPQRGYELDCKELNDAHSLTRAFWLPHLESGKQISLIYVEQRFFLDEPRGLVFRYYDCNEENNEVARAELEARHGDHPNMAEVIPLHPYVARGEINARDLIVQWFRKYAFEEVEQSASRAISDKSPTWEHSLILFGSGAGNRFVSSVLKRYPSLPIQRVGRTRFQVGPVARKPLPREEMARLKRAESEGRCRLIGDQGRLLEFDPKSKIAPLLITRVPNPDGTHPPVTIFDSERGKTVEQIAAVLTDDELICAILERCGFTALIPVAFQILFAVSMRSHEREVYPLVWRVPRRDGSIIENRRIAWQ